jgi:hypothetical protein
MDHQLYTIYNGTSLPQISKRVRVEESMNEDHPTKRTLIADDTSPPIKPNTGATTLPPTPQTISGKSSLTSLPPVSVTSNQPSVPSSTSQSVPSPRNMSIGSSWKDTTLAPTLTELKFGKLVVSLETLPQFMGWKCEALLAFDCIDIVAPATLRSRVPFGNNLKNITFDLSNLPDGSFYKVTPQVGWLIATSSCARQLIVKDKLDRSSVKGSITTFDFCEVQRCFDFGPKVKTIADGIYWIWKRETGDKLSWTW